MGQTSITDSHTATHPTSDHSDDQNSESKTWMHVLGAASVVILTAAALIFAPGFGKRMRIRQVNAIQSGVVADLSLIARSEAEFFKTNGFFTTDLQALKIAPKKVLYKFGFIQASEAQPGRTDIDPSRKDLDALKKANTKLNIEYSPVTELEQIKFDRLSSFCQDCTASQNQFKAIAAANLDSDPILDVWTVDEKGNVSHVIDDLK